MTYDDIVMCVNDTIDNSRFDVLTPFKMRAMLTLLRKAVPELKPMKLTAVEACCPLGLPGLWLEWPVQQWQRSPRQSSND